MVGIVEVQLELLHGANHAWHFVRIQSDQSDVPIQKDIFYESEESIATVKLG